MSHPGPIVPITKLTPEQEYFKMTMKAMGLQSELNVERQRCDDWRKLANGYEDIRTWLRLCNDDPAGHTEFYKQACLIVFGSYGDNFLDDGEE